MRVLVVADDPLARAGLASLLADQSDALISGQSTSADLLVSLSVYAPNVIVWDMGWAPAVAIERLASLDDNTTETIAPVLALLADDSSAVEVWLAGARGLFLRSTAPDRLIAALFALTRGLIVIDPALSNSLIAHRERTDEHLTPPLEDLTARESQVLQALAQGLPNKVIAQRLSISESTVKFHVNSIMGKLGAQSRTDAVVRATRLGLIIL